MEPDPQHGVGLTFSEALEQLKDGRKVTRARWTDAEGRDQWIVRQDGYPQGIPLNANTARATGLPEGSEQKFAPYYMLYTIYSTFVPWTPVPWTPGHGDLNADDWAIYYMPGEYARLCQEETDAILADPDARAELEADGKDLLTFSHEEVKMVVALRALERENLADKDAIRFRLVRQLLRPVVGGISQVDLADPVREDGANALPQVLGVIHAFVTIITKLNEDFTVAKLDLDATKAKIASMERFDESWRSRRPIPEGMTTDDEIYAYQRLRYFQDQSAGQPGFTQSTWRLIATLLAPMLEEWRQSHADTTGDFDPDRFHVEFTGLRTDGVDTIGYMGLKTLPRITEEDQANMLGFLEGLRDPEATQQLIRPGDPDYPQRPARIADAFPLARTPELAEGGDDTGPRKLRMLPVVPDGPVESLRYFVYSGTGDNGVEEEVSEAEYLRAADIIDPFVAIPDSFNNGLTRGRVKRVPQ